MNENLQTKSEMAAAIEFHLTLAKKDNSAKQFSQKVVLGNAWCYSPFGEGNVSGG